MSSSQPELETIAFSRSGRALKVCLNRPASLNAFNLEMHDELPRALEFAANDPSSDVIILTGAGKAFSAGGDLEHIARNAAEPERFDHEIAMAKEIVERLIGLEKPVVCRLNGHAIGLGATIALLCDIIIAADGAKIGDPHVNIGLVAGDGGAIIWPHRIGLTRAKEFLLTGEPITAEQAVKIGLISRSVPLQQLDQSVDDVCQSLLSKPQFALRRTKALLNMELKRLSHTLLDPGLRWEAESVRDPDHAEAIAALREKRKPNFHRD
ncbi:enoyl-CoA hydratase/isomerase family protein [Pontixanthobacter aquaemixtae]|uniref:Enoyl-CoA hydratase/isomerase family protein n=1 Tax=Pontixanthobacter aquaemixtae TaxID=1958940 RepID=A0A844ZRP6_9SPHN|nr:enoyl-CoA hydratase/isomerase family protein [Pontixanthobacter aquaemixtae]MXO89992.1 enoyl-CoA hydratase/isomerase family protein [Pontixanthobacter aquaemixtae]